MTTNVRRLLVAVGAILLIAGVVALLVPISVSDGNGRQVGCGNAIAEDTSGAQSATNSGVGSIPILNQIVPHTDFVGLCDSAVSSRRSWSIPLAVVGVLVVGGAFLLRGRGRTQGSTRT